MRTLLYIFFLLVMVSLGAMADGVTSFEPLSSGERLAYSMHRENDTNVMTLYKLDPVAKRKTMIGQWEHVEEGQGVQFANNHTLCFFPVYTFSIPVYMTPGSDVIHTYNAVYDLYLADGSKGTIRCITKVVFLFRVSNEGKYLCYIKDGSNMAEATIVLFDLENGKLINEIRWKTNEPIEGGWHVNRLPDNIFRIFGTWEGGTICAVAVLNPQTQELTVDWDKTNSQETILPHVGDEDWHDDVIKQQKDPNVKLVPSE